MGPDVFYLTDSDIEAGKDLFWFLKETNTLQGACTDFHVGFLRLHQFVDDLAEFVCVGELPLCRSACCGR